jgi:8-oxo-dGTP pyrophosphatase MutT (NUDIX family)
MAISDYYRALRNQVGTSLLMVPAVAAIIRDELGRVLLQQAHDESWSLPAGAIAPGETPAQAVMREVFEETGLAVVPANILGVVGGSACRVRYANGDDVEYVVTVFECYIVGGALGASNDETKHLEYFAIEDLPRLAFSYPSELFARPRRASYFDGTPIRLAPAAERH